MEEQLQLARRELEACTQLCRSQMALSFMFLTCKAENAENVGFVVMIVMGSTSLLYKSVSGLLC